MMLHTKYQGSMPCGFRQSEDGWTEWTQGRRKNYITLTLSGDNKLGRGPLDDATYQIPRLYALWFQTRIIKKFHLENLFLACVS